MHKILRYGLVAGLGSMLTCFSSCSQKETPTPAPTSAVAAAPTVANAQAWFAQQTGVATHRTTDSAATQPPAIDWAHATRSENYVVAPFVDTSNPFAEAKEYGYRFLVMR